LYNNNGFVIIIKVSVLIILLLNISLYNITPLGRLPTMAIPIDAGLPRSLNGPRLSDADTSTFTSISPSAEKLGEETAHTPPMIMNTMDREPETGPANGSLDFKPSLRFYLTFVTLSVITLAAALDATSLSVALPIITDKLGGTAIEAFWYVYAH
jgi:hypothetical protein